MRERRDDIPVLIDYFVNKLHVKNGLPKKTFSKDAIEVIKSLNFTGNIRELKNLVERIMIMVPDEVVKLEAVKKYLPADVPDVDGLFDSANSFAEFKEKTEKMFIEKHLKLNNWNISKTAESLGIQRSHLYNKIKKYNLEKQEN